MIKDMVGPIAEKEQIQEASEEIVQKVSQEVIPYVTDNLFKIIDRDGDGGLVKTEIEFIMKSLEQDPAACFGMLFEVIDQNGDGKLEASEVGTFFKEILKLGGDTAKVFITVFAATFKDTAIGQVLDEIFSNLDENGDDRLDQDELQGIRAGFQEGKNALKEFSEQPGPWEIVFELLKTELEALNAAGDMNHEQFYALFNTLLQKQMSQCNKILHDEDKGVAPPELIKAHKDLIATMFESIEEAFGEAMREPIDAYFNLLDANSDGIISQEELSALTGLIDMEASGEECFDRIIKIMEAPNKEEDQGVITREEATTFMGKLFDLFTSSVKGAVDFYLAVLSKIAVPVFSTLITKIVQSGDSETENTISRDKFTEIAQAFAEDGPEVLLAPLMDC